MYIQPKLNLGNLLFSTTREWSSWVSSVNPNCILNIIKAKHQIKCTFNLKSTLEICFFLQPMNEVHEFWTNHIHQSYLVKCSLTVTWLSWKLTNQNSLLETTEYSSHWPIIFLVCFSTDMLPKITDQSKLILGNLLSWSTNEMMFMGFASIRWRASWLSTKCFQFISSPMRYVTINN